MDSSIYGALVYASQIWNMRYPLIDFHGNNGSRDGDEPAAYRYTECRLAPISEAALADIKKDTVDWTSNFSETEEEPVYLPGRFPTLLCNGTTGIAVAMACSFAPHNLNEIMDAIIYLERNKNATIEELLQFIKGPDFPTGGTIVNKDELKAAYCTGRGRVKVRGDYEVISEKGHDTVVFTSIPFKVSKENLIAEIDTLCEEKKLDGITEIRDESNKKGVRFVIELAKGINGNVIANKLYRLTGLESSYSFNQVALVNKSPKLLNFKELCEYYLKHQEDVFTRKCKFDLKKLSDRVHILEGFLKAIEDIDNIIKCIKNSDSTTAAKVELIKRYNFSQVQAQAILDMKLSRLAHTEKIAVEKEMSEKRLQVDKLNNILSNESVASDTLCAELVEFKNKFGDERRTKVTQVADSKEEKEVAEIIPEECVVVVGKSGSIKRIPASSYRTQKRNTKGMKNQSEESISIVKTNTIDNLMVFSSFGKIYKLSVEDIPIGNNLSHGVAIETLVPMEKGEIFVTSAFLSRATKSNEFVWFITKNGLVKKVNVAEYSEMKRKTGVIATNIKEGDSLVKVFVSPNTDIILFTKLGICLRFKGESLGSSSRTATGLKGISLSAEDSIVDVIALNGEKEIAVFTRGGLSKRIPTDEFLVQNRAGRGLVCYKNAEVVAACAINESDMVLITGDLTSLCIEANSIIPGSRTSQGGVTIKNSHIIDVIRIN